MEGSRSSLELSLTYSVAPQWDPGSPIQEAPQCLQQEDCHSFLISANNRVHSEVDQHISENERMFSLTLYPSRGFPSARHRASPCAGGGIKIPPETAPGGFLVPRDRQSEESRAISGNYYRNCTLFPHRSAASLRRPTSAADATLSRRTMPPVSSLLLSH